jgi:hypothetical protein
MRLLKSKDLFSVRAQFVTCIRVAFVHVIIRAAIPRFASSDSHLLHVLLFARENVLRDIEEVSQRVQLLFGVEGPALARDAVGQGVFGLHDRVRVRGYRWEACTARIRASRALRVDGLVAVSQRRERIAITALVASWLMMFFSSGFG